MKKVRNKSEQQNIFVKWNPSVIVEGRLKKIFVSKFKRKIMILENDNTLIFVPLTTVLENTFSRYKHLLKPDVNIYIECVDERKGKYNKYYDFEIMIDNIDITNDYGVELL